MLIVSQNKKRIMNFDQVYGLEIYEDKGGMFDIATMTDNGIGIGERILGTYESEEKANDVLEQIARYYEVSKAEPEFNIFYMP